MISAVIEFLPEFNEGIYKSTTLVSLLLFRKSDLRLFIQLLCQLSEVIFTNKFMSAPIMPPLTYRISDTNMLYQYVINSDFVDSNKKSRNSLEM